MGTIATTKITRLRDLMAAGEWNRALALASSFRRLGEHATAIRRAHEAAARPDFQRQLGRDPAALRAAGIEALQARYGPKATKTDAPQAATVTGDGAEVEAGRARDGGDAKGIPGEAPGNACGGRAGGAICDLCGTEMAGRPAGRVSMTGGGFGAGAVCGPCAAAIEADLKKPIAERDLGHRDGMNRGKVEPGAAPLEAPRASPRGRDGGPRAQVAIRVDRDVWAALGALAARLPIGRAALAREAMRLGVERIEREGAAVLDRGAGGALIGDFNENGED